MIDPDFDDLNPPPPVVSGEWLPALIVWAFILWGVVALVRWIF